MSSSMAESTIVDDRSSTAASGLEEEEEEEDMRRTVALLEAVRLEALNEAEDERDMNRTLAMLSTVVQRNETDALLDREDEADMRKTMALLEQQHAEAQAKEEERDMANTVKLLVQVAQENGLLLPSSRRRVFFADDLDVLEMENGREARLARRGKWKPGPFEDELWNGYMFRDVELTPEELEEALRSKQSRATRILKGLFWANKKVNIEGKAHALRTAPEEEEDEEEGENEENEECGSKEGENEVSPTASPKQPPRKRSKARLASLFRRTQHHHQ